MSGLFEEIKLGWKGKTFTIPPRRVIEAVAIVEEVITLQELLGYSARGGVPTARLARAYSKVLNFAGCQVTVEEVYEGMFDSQLAGDIGTSINILLMMMIPPKIREALEAGKSIPAPVLKKGEVEPSQGNQKAPAKGASSVGSKSRSALDGSQRQTTGH